MIGIPPGEEGIAEQIDGRWRDTAAGAFSSECGDGAGMAEEERRFFPYFGQEFIEVVGGWRAGAGFDALRIGDVVQKAVTFIVEQLAFLSFLDGLDGEANLFANLIEWITEEIGDSGLDISDGGDGVEAVLARLFVVIHEGLWDSLFVFLVTDDFDGTFVDDFVDSEGAGLEGLPIEEADEPAGRDGTVLGRGLGDICELKSCLFAKHVLCGFCHDSSPDGVVQTRARREFGGEAWRRNGLRVHCPAYWALLWGHFYCKGMFAASR